MNIKEYSGGMRSKLLLTKLILEQSDVLILDEPTNFLDSKHIDWLTKYLNSFQKTFIVVSHDMHFVNNIAKTILALENHQITKYKGNYDFYIKERNDQLLKQEKDYKNQQSYINKAQTFINRFLYKATLTTRAQSKRKALEKLVKIPPPKKEQQIHFRFKDSTPSGRDVLITKGLLIGYNNEPLIDAITINIYKEDFILISGKNGVGKSTFIKTILGEIPKIDGTFRFSLSAKINYFEQDCKLSMESTPYELVSLAYDDLKTFDIRSHLGSFGIDYSLQNRQLKDLSGGEITRLRLCLLAKNDSNVFILDEPTNHLDTNTKRALKEALIHYKGTVILVSHDKSFYEDLVSAEIKFS